MKTSSGIVSNDNHFKKLSIAGLLVTLGIVYGDIGTSPLYVMKAILSASNGVNTDFILGALSCIIWTLTLQTTFKYVIITLRADNKGEGGIFSLYALIRRRARWVFIFAILGGAMLLADGIITPAITVVSAIEGLQLINSNIPVLPIVLTIIAVLFFIQQYGTNFLGKWFGPIMFIWFALLGILGLAQLMQYPLVLKAFNPYYALNLIINHPNVSLLMGAVFLCTTGAEALYSDLGHCGLKNIRISWIFVKSTLILNYLGQGAWILMNTNNITSETNPFYTIMPSWFLVTGVIIATAAAIIASQALISGSYSIISEAIRLNFWPKVRVLFPSHYRGQIYIPSINIFLWIGCSLVILFFQKSSAMEAAYGLAITITMLMTTVLLTIYLWIKHYNKIFVVFLCCLFVLIESSFLIANVAKFMHGGWVTIVIAGLIFLIMFIWYKAKTIKIRFYEFVKINNYKEIITEISEDSSIQKCATNLIFITKAGFPDMVESKILYSIINKQPKRADIYWLVQVHDADNPYNIDYKIETLIPRKMYKIDFKIGFKVQPRLNLFIKEVMEDLTDSGEIDTLSRYPSLRKYTIQGDVKYIVLETIQNYDFDFSPFEQIIMDIYSIMKNWGISDAKDLGLDTSNVTIENVPMKNPKPLDLKMNRIKGL